MQIRNSSSMPNVATSEVEGRLRYHFVAEGSVATAAFLITGSSRDKHHTSDHEYIHKHRELGFQRSLLKWSGA
jgi:hypothetical protein